jgi:hypothetical protein
MVLNIVTARVILSLLTFRNARNFEGSFDLCASLQVDEWLFILNFDL